MLGSHTTRQQEARKQGARKMVVRLARPTKSMTPVRSTRPMVPMVLTVPTVLGPRSALDLAALATLATLALLPCVASQIVLNASVRGLGDAQFGQGGCSQKFNMVEIQEMKEVSDPQKWVDAHNYYRRCHGAPELRWAPELLVTASAWVHQLLAHCATGQDLEAWAAAGATLGRPHDPNLFTTEKPQQAENLDCRQYDSIHDPEAASVEAWYREVSACPKAGWVDGCGGKLNHYTALIWRDARRVACYVALRGDMRVVSCRYAAEGDDTTGCQVPNTVGPPGSEGCQLGAGVADHLPEVPRLKKDCPAISAAFPSPSRPAAPVKQPAQAPLGAPQAAAHGAGLGCVDNACMVSCIPRGRLGACERCLHSEQCSTGMYCCPFMKKCVASGKQQCMTPIAFCQPPCMDDQPLSECKCNPKGSPDLFPEGWQKATCAAGQSPVAVTTTPKPSSPPAKLIFTGIKDVKQWNSISEQIGKHMQGWKATRMCASIEATTPSPEQQDVFLSAKGVFVFQFSDMSTLNAQLTQLDGITPSFQVISQKEVDQVCANNQRLFSTNVAPIASDGTRFGAALPRAAFALLLFVALGRWAFRRGRDSAEGTLDAELGDRSSLLH